MLLLPIAGSAQTTAPKQKTVWDGVFSQSEVDRGLTAYNTHCSVCHGQNLTGFGSVLIGGRFMDRWREDSLSNLFKMIRDTMPPGSRERLSDAQYVDILAYVLHKNDFPVGTTDFVPSEFDRILIVGKEGPMPVPDFSLVEVVGCLARDAAKVWMLTDASEPVRTRNPRESTAVERDRAVARSAGDHTFRFLETYEFPSEFKVGRWMEAKGFLIRSPGNDRINVTWLKGISETCEGHKESKRE